MHLFFQLIGRTISNFQELVRFNEVFKICENLRDRTASYVFSLVFRIFQKQHKKVSKSYRKVISKHPHQSLPRFDGSSCRSFARMTVARYILFAVKSSEALTHKPNQCQLSPPNHLIAIFFHHKPDYNSRIQIHS